MPPPPCNLRILSLSPWCYLFSGLPIHSLSPLECLVCLSPSLLAMNVPPLGHQRFFSPRISPITHANVRALPLVETPLSPSPFFSFFCKSGTHFSPPKALPFLKVFLSTFPCKPTRAFSSYGLSLPSRFPPADPVLSPAYFELFLPPPLQDSPLPQDLHSLFFSSFSFETDFYWLRQILPRVGPTAFPFFGSPPFHNARHFCWSRLFFPPFPGCRSQGDGVLSSSVFLDGTDLYSFLRKEWQWRCFVRALNGPPRMTFLHRVGANIAINVPLHGGRSSFGLSLFFSQGDFLLVLFLARSPPFLNAILFGYSTVCLVHASNMFPRTLRFSLLFLMAPDAPPPPPPAFQWWLLFGAGIPSWCHPRSLPVAFFLFVFPKYLTRASRRLSLPFFPQPSPLCNSLVTYHEVFSPFFRFVPCLLLPQSWFFFSRRT